MATTKAKAKAEKGRREAPGVEEQLRAALERDQRSPGELSRAAGVDERAIRRYLRRERGITLGCAARLAEAVGMHLVRVKGRR